MNISGADADKPIDFAAINNAALARGRTFLQALIPGGKFRGLEYIVRNPRRDDQHAGSFTINYRTGVWKDFASSEGGGDPISLVAYVRDCSQSDAAREMAAELGVSFLKTENANGHYRNGKSLAASTEKPKVYGWGDSGPPVRDDEVRRHVYSSSGRVMRIKIKSRGGRFCNWYRTFSNGGLPIGWQAKKPDNYISIPYVTAAVDPFDPELRHDDILWPEGEKDVETLSKLSVPAFTFGGVGDGLPDGIEHYLKDRRIVILADNDDPGRDHAEKKAAVAHAAGAASIKVVHFLELPPKGDVSDFIAGGGTDAQLYARIDGTPPWSPPVSNHPSSESGAKPNGKTAHASLVIKRASEIEPTRISWLWPDRIAIGKQTLIAGDVGLGKSQLTAYLAAAVTKGGQWPCSEGQATPGSVVIFSAEDDAKDTIVPRLHAADADVSRVRIVEAVETDDGKGNKSRRMFHLEADLAQLEAALDEIGDVRLVIIDPISAYLGKVDAHGNSDVRGVLGAVAELAARRSVAVVAVSHWNKSGTGPAVNRVTGSGAFTAAVRAAFMVAKDPDDDERRLFVPMKTNIGPPKGGLAFRLEQRLVGKGNDIVAPNIVWESERITKTADEILAATDHAGPHQSAVLEAVDWLQQLLARDAMQATLVQAEAEAAGLSWATVRRAKKVAGIETYREGGTGKAGHWFWRLPPDEPLRRSSSPYDAQERNVSTLGEFEHLSADEPADASVGNGKSAASPAASGGAS
jgi:putative DNA primase/helicase